MNGGGNWGGGPHADDEYRGDSDYVYPSESGRQWQPGWDLGRRADGDETDRGYGGQPAPGYGSYSGDAYPSGYTNGGYSSGSYSRGDYPEGGYPAGGYPAGGYTAGGHPDADQPSADPSGNGYSQQNYGHGYSDGYGGQGYGDTTSSQSGYQASDYGNSGYGDPSYGGEGREVQGPVPGGYSVGPDTYSASQDSYSAGPDSHSAGPVGYGASSDTYSASSDGYSTGSPGYGRASYASDGYGDETGAMDRADSGWFDRPSTGSFDRPDTGSFGRPDTGSFGRPDTGSFERPDPGSSGRAGDYQNGDYEAGDYQAGEYQNGRQPAAGGYDQFGYPPDEGEDLNGPAAWDADDQDDQEDQEGDWQDDGDAGLLSRRFGGDDGGDKGRRGRRSGRSRRPKRARGRVAFTASIVVVALVVIAGGVFGYKAYQSWYNGRNGDYSGAGTCCVTILVPEGASLGQLGPALLKKGVIKELRPYDTAAHKAANADDLQPGEYKLHEHMSAAIAVSYLLSSAHRSQDQLTIIEGTRAVRIAAKLAAQTKQPASAFTQIIEHPPASLGLPSWAPKGVSAEGFLFPDTYTLLPNMTPLQILQMMVKEFNEKVDGIDLAGASKKVFTTPWHALIVASLIQAEAGNVTDFKKISRVAWNRIGKNMPLQFDSTVFYALGRFGTAVNSQEEKVKSPYNTYAHAGLPPGPIGSPGLLAIEAAVHPAEGADKNLLYFITDTRKKPYVTHFTDSLSQLQQWQAEFGN